MTGKPAFNIGISMAGAVSGGAYSAGVFDFLMEALSEWQAAKDRGEKVPSHDVIVSAMSGTSAGGITAAMGLAALAGGIRSVEEPSVNPAWQGPIKRVLPELYDIWVRRVRLFDVGDTSAKSDGGAKIPALLDLGDIRPKCAPDSLLNSDVLTHIARASLSSIRPSGQRLAFFTKPVHLFLTHTNLDGVPYPIEFTTGDAYTMMLHEGRAHFAVTGLGLRDYPSECDWLAKWRDGGMAIDLSQLGSLSTTGFDVPLNEPFETYAQAALTTSAFPFGFSARRVGIDRAKMRANALPFDPGKFASVVEEPTPGFMPQNDEEKRAYFVCIDGGAMNNEPFEIVRWAIRAKNNERNSRDRKKADRAVILIAPFPPNASVSKEAGKKDRPIGINFIGKALVPALINQARFKAADLITASDPDVYSRFLISPRPELASAPLYAFGGFLDEQFREHDFMLGRRNCQWFLKQHFTLHRENPIFGEDAEAAYKAIEDSERPFDDDEWPIIPLVGSAAQEVEPWGNRYTPREVANTSGGGRDLPLPVMPRRSMDELRSALQRRCDLLVSAYTADVLKDYPSLRLGGRFSWWLHRGRIVNDLMRLIEKELGKQIEPKPKLNLLSRLWRYLHRPLVAWVLLLAIAFFAIISQIFFYDPF